MIRPLKQDYFEAGHHFQLLLTFDQTVYRCHVISDAQNALYFSTPLQYLDIYVVMYILCVIFHQCTYIVNLLCNYCIKPDNILPFLRIH